MNAQPKLRAISNISRDIAQVLFASVFIGPMISGGSSLFTLAIGFVLSMSFWLLSVGLVTE